MAADPPEASHQIGLVACVSLFALGVINFQRALILFGVLQLPPVVLRREWFPARLIEIESSEEAGTDS